ncbi:hypothetical protein CAP39_10575 [Sphingomonas sp. IBVSS1]|nr:hypothetical protein CAP39_10575 [Sphingomonas sp. IBVSS1]
MMKKLMILAGVAATALTASAPAAAVTTTFANFSAQGAQGNFRWVRSGNNATFYTTDTTGNQAGRQVTFSFLQPSISPFVTNINAVWTMSGSVTNTIATISGNTLNQANLTGSFSFITTQAITIGANTFAAGSNLLSGSFSLAQLSGTRGGNSAGISGSTPPTNSVTYTSDFLTFGNTNDRNFAINLTSVNPVLQAAGGGTPFTPTSAVNSFRAVAGGSFSSDPAPIVTAVPEPGTWALMIAGMGLVGFARRRRQISVAA